ncbi:hypothetical protein RHMOL_Rhmol05G0030600 [Rhododendron molle]|uniref:Uncharacterized protein n=1 Tax=Rhododendron molle TaxID=49168 RepID=A0ACC0NK29_RHOML|nr:hypothetical protein RHMOL_Rhmol05G0030600 [Rhododendron molle]
MEPSDRLWWRNPTPNDAHEDGACPASTVATVEPTLSHVSFSKSSIRFFSKYSYFPHDFCTILEESEK